jgi:hypothetical protein
VTDILGFPVLVLNRNFDPIEVTSVRRALVLMYCGGAQAFDEGELYDFELWRELTPRDEVEVIPIIGGALRVPRVLHLARYERRPRLGVRLNRRNLMFRDGFECQYCQGRPGLAHLNMDHVFPRSRGGPTSWENLVTSCRTCNLRKGGRTPDEANMRLARKPVRPRWSVATQITLRHPSPFREWVPFLKAS